MADVIARGIAAGKLDKSGGVIGGNLSIGGNLNVVGTTVTTKQETLLVKKNMLVTNSDGATLVGLSGIGIKDGSTDVYGIVYDKTDNAIKLGIGKLDSNNNFTFNEGEGEPLAIRADSSLFVDGHYVKWDATNKMFVDGGEIESSPLSYKGVWSSSVTYKPGDVVSFSFTTDNKIYTFKYLSLRNDNINNSPSSDFDVIDTYYWMCLVNDSICSSKTNSVYVSNIDHNSSDIKYPIVLTTGNVSSYNNLFEDYNISSGIENIYALGGELYDSRGLTASSVALSNESTNRYNNDIVSVEFNASSLILTKGDNNSYNAALPIASNIGGGIVTNSAQTFGGLKTFDEGLKVDDDSKSYVIGSWDDDTIYDVDISNVAEFQYMYDQTNHTAKIIGGALPLPSTYNVFIPKFTKYNNQWYKIVGTNDSSFSNLLYLSSVSIPDSVKNIGAESFSNCIALKNITIPDCVTSIGNSAFSGCKKLTSISIPDSVTNIGLSAFSGCNNMASVAISKNLTDLNDSIFSGCSNLASVYIPDSVEHIGNFSFYNCGNLANVEIGDGVKSIGKNAFQNCGGITNITIPASVSNIDNTSFSNCANLTNITILRDDSSVISGSPWGANNATVTYERRVTDDQINTWGNIAGELTLHINNTSNPHFVTKSQIGLGNIADLPMDNIAINASPNYITSGAVFDATKYIGIVKNSITAQQKIVEIPDFTLEVGNVINVYFQSSLTGDISLKIGDANYVRIRHRGTIEAGWNMLYYDGGYFYTGDYMPMLTNNVLVTYPGMSVASNGKFVFNTNIDIPTTDSILANVPLTIATGMTGSNEIGIIINDDLSLSLGQFGLYVIDLTKFGGVGYSIASVSATVANIFTVHKIIYISDIGAANLQIASNFIQDFNPTSAGWQVSSYDPYLESGLSPYFYPTSVALGIGVSLIIGIVPIKYNIPGTPSPIEEMWKAMDILVSSKLS